MSLITHRTPEGVTVKITDEAAFDSSAAEVARLHERMKIRPPEDHPEILVYILAHLDAQKVYLTTPKPTKPDVEELQRFATFLIDYYIMPAADVRREHEVYYKEIGEIMDLYDEWEIACRVNGRRGNAPRGWPTPRDRNEAFMLWYAVPTLKRIIGQT